MFKAWTVLVRFFKWLSLSNDNITNSNFGLGGSIAFPVELQINEDDFERAKEVMKEGGYAKYLQEEE